MTWNSLVIFISEQNDEIAETALRIFVFRKVHLILD